MRHWVRSSKVDSSCQMPGMDDNENTKKMQLFVSGAGPCQTTAIHAASETLSEVRIERRFVTLATRGCRIRVRTTIRARIMVKITFAPKGFPRATRRQSDLSLAASTTPSVDCSSPHPLLQSPHTPPLVSDLPNNRLPIHSQNFISPTIYKVE